MVPFVCTVSGVYDGDTFYCRTGEAVRIWGIDAPEMNTRAGPPSGAALRAMLTGRVLVCLPRGRSYRRIVARCFLHNQDIAWPMVRGGWAHDWPRYSSGFYRLP